MLLNALASSHQSPGLSLLNEEVVREIAGKVTIFRVRLNAMSLHAGEALR